jgi:cytidine deaminase
VALETFKLDSKDQELITAAQEVIRRNYDGERHSVGSAVLCASGKIYTGVNIDSCGYGPCAEPIAMGVAISSGERKFQVIVAVNGSNPGDPLMSPCGNCRQLLLDYAPDVMVILKHNGKAIKVKISDLLPAAYLNF